VNGVAALSVPGWLVHCQADSPEWGGSDRRSQCYMIKLRVSACLSPGNWVRREVLLYPRSVCSGIEQAGFVAVVESPKKVMLIDGLIQFLWWHKVAAVSVNTAIIYPGPVACCAGLQCSWRARVVDWIGAIRSVTTVLGRLQLPLYHAGLLGLRPHSLVVVRPGAN
jgi:hypothetical protein